MSENGCGKMQFASRAEAKTHARYLKRTQGDTPHSTRATTPYVCGQCGQWHLTSRTKVEKRRIDRKLGERPSQAQPQLTDAQLTIIAALDPGPQNAADLLRALGRCGPEAPGRGKRRRLTDQLLTLSEYVEAVEDVHGQRMWQRRPNDRVTTTGGAA